jgi:lysophospholipase L1-like esterase
MTELRLFVIAVAAAGALAASAQAQDADRSPPVCTTPFEYTHLGKPLLRVAVRVARREGVKILAFGSSSTEGYGASALDKTYPSRLESELRTLLPGVPLRVVNRGVGGEDAREMLVRLDRELLEVKPDLVLWQVGTNAILRNNGIADQAPLIRDGLRRIRSAGADVMLINPQYAPVVLLDPDAKPMVALLSQIAQETGAPVFRRFALMRHWHQTGEFSFADILSSDLFHMNDWSYGCLAKNLAVAIAGAVTQPTPAPAKDIAEAAARASNWTAGGNLQAGR